MSILTYCRIASLSVSVLDTKSSSERRIQAVFILLGACTGMPETRKPRELTTKDDQTLCPRTMGTVYVKECRSCGRNDDFSDSPPGSTEPKKTVLCWAYGRLSGDEKRHYNSLYSKFIQQCDGNEKKDAEPVREQRHPWHDHGYLPDD